MNLLVIQTDEHNFRTLGCYRDTLPESQALIWGPEAVVETPHIDSVARRGAIFTSFYATSPVCTPSRASFFTGVYPHNTGSPQNDLPMRNEMITFAEALRRKGYKTGYAGKWHLDGNGKPQWAPIRKFGFEDNRYMFNRGHWKKFEITPAGPRVASRKKDKPSYGLGDADEQSFATDWLTDRALDFMRQHADQPFCFHLSLPDPHGPNTVREPYSAMYANVPIRAPYTFGKTAENPVWGKAAEGRNGVSKFRADQMSQYFGMVKCIDDNVGRILATLKSLQIADKTAVVFTSDHGDLCYEHGRLNKGNPYEASAKIPMLLCVPGQVEPGSRIDEALGTVDFLPTILPLLKCEVPEGVQGRDFRGLLQDKRSSSWQDVTFLRNAGLKAAWVAAVSDRHKLVLSLQDRPWLFDHNQDPDELINFCGKEDCREVERQLAQALLDYGKKFQDPFLMRGSALARQAQEIADR